MSREDQLLAANIVKTLGEARTAEHSLSSILENSTSEGLDDPENEEYIGANETLKFYIEKLFRDVGILAERLGLSLYARKVSKVYQAYDQKDLPGMLSSPWDVGLTSEPLREVGALYRSLSPLVEAGALSGLDVFRTILQNTAAIIRTRSIFPKNEAEVRSAIFEVLGFAFHDAIREIPIGQLLKTYKPDMGVRSLGAAAEYKFVTSEQELKSAVDGIYTDMKGYSGHSEWRTFFAVIYTTEALAHQQKIEEEFRGVKADLAWELIVIVGQGGKGGRPD